MPLVLTSLGGKCLNFSCCYLCIQNCDSRSRKILTLKDFHLDLGMAQRSSRIAQLGKLIVFQLSVIDRVKKKKKTEREGEKERMKGGWGKSSKQEREVSRFTVEEGRRAQKEGWRTHIFTVPCPLRVKPPIRLLAWGRTRCTGRGHLIPS